MEQPASMVPHACPLLQMLDIAPVEVLLQMQPFYLRDVFWWHGARKVSVLWEVVEDSREATFGVQLWWECGGFLLMLEVLREVQIFERVNRSHAPLPTTNYREIVVRNCSSIQVHHPYITRLDPSKKNPKGLLTHDHVKVKTNLGRRSILKRPCIDLCSLLENK